MSDETTGPVGPAGPPGERGRTGRISSTAWLVIIVACLIVTGIGVQAWLFQRAADERDSEAAQQRDCITEWAVALTDTIQLRANGNAELRAATTRKDNADDAVLDVFVDAFITSPPPPQAELEEQFREALEEYVAAKKNLQIVSGTVEGEQAKNPYPVLDLECAPK